MAPTNEPPRELMLAQRVLPMDEYVAELREDKGEVAKRLRRRFGVRVVPIAVPLAPGDTQELYEQRFLALHSTVMSASSAVGERAARCLFARRTANEYTQKQRAKDRDHDHATTKPTKPTAEVSRTTTAKAPTTAASVGHPTVERPFHVRDTQRVVELDEFRRDYHSGQLNVLRAMTKDEKLARFGVPVVPIFVPLARGESKAQYEARFVAWLGKTHKLTLDEARRHANPAHERSLRLQFAGLNAKGTVRFDPASSHHKRGRDDGDDLVTTKQTAQPKKARADDTDSRVKCSMAGEKTLDAFTACGCDACLLSAMKLIVQNTMRIEQDTPCSCRSKRQVVPSKDAVVLDLTGDDHDDDHGNDHRAIAVDSGSDDLCELVTTPAWLPVIPTAAPDAVEERLQREFDELNELVVLNREALDAAVDELVRTPPGDLAEMTRLHDENEEMRRLIEKEGFKRRVALALLVLYVWRHDRDALERMVNDKTASDVAHVQRVSYATCMALASDATATPRDVSRHEMAVLVHFDVALRECLAQLLRRVDG